LEIFAAFSPFLIVDHSNGPECASVVHLARLGLRALDAALGHVEGDVAAGGEGACSEADRELLGKLGSGNITFMRLTVILIF
jgi:hypothetical protein